MALQELYDQLLRLARLNPRVIVQGAEIDDACHSTNVGEPPLCLSPDDLTDPEVQRITYDGQLLGPMQVLEAYRQLVRLDHTDGRLDGKLPERGPLPFIVPIVPISAVRYFGPLWTPDRRLQTYMQWHQGKFATQLPAPDQSFKLARSFVSGRTQTFVEESYPLAPQEVAFVTDAAERLRAAGHTHAANVVTDVVSKARVIFFRPGGITDDLGRTMLFPQRHEDGEVSVFFSTTVRKGAGGGRRLFYQYEVDQPPTRPLRGQTTRKVSLARLIQYLHGRAVPKGLYDRLPSYLRDIYVYRYLRYRVGPEDRLRSAQYMRVVVLHEALHAAALARAPVKSNGHDGGGATSFNWDAYAARLSQPPPNPTDTLALVDYLADLLMFQRATLEVAQDLKRRSESPDELFTVEDAKKLYMALQLYTLTEEAVEHLVDEAAWRLTFGPGQLGEQPFPSVRGRLLNRNEDFLSRFLR